MSTTADLHKTTWHLQAYLERRDFQGALTLLRFQAKHGNKKDMGRNNTLWQAYVLFHLGDYDGALKLYHALRVCYLRYGHHRHNENLTYDVVT